MIDVQQMRAIVLAAGLGKRMRPLTDILPKPLISVGGKCLVDHALDFLSSAGIGEAVVNTHYLAPLLEAHLEKRTIPHIRISYEETLLETGGGVLQALPMLGEGAFFSINSDTICVNGARHALMRLADMWDDVSMDALLLLHPTEKAVGYAGAGDFSLSDEGQLTRRKKDEVAPYVFTGVQILHPRIFQNLPMGAFSLNVLYDRLMQPSVNTSPRIRALVHDGKWLHVGEPHAIKLAEAEL
jgi:MurNAc alpha-1-phosphate uridylyltransferase